MAEILNLNTEDDNRPSIFSRRKFNYIEVLQLAKDLADAVNYIHNEISPQAMIIHRDMKPDNIGLTSEGRLKLFDFGLCRCVKKRPDNKLSTAYEMTGHTGSLRYMAPEVVLDKPYNEKDDVYRYGRTNPFMTNPPIHNFSTTQTHALHHLTPIYDDLHQLWHRCVDDSDEQNAVPRVSRLCPAHTLSIYDHYHYSLPIDLPLPTLL